MKRATPKPKPIHVTKRDTKLLQYLSIFGMLTTEQVYRLCFTSVSRTRKRLRLLWQHGLINRHSRPMRMGEGTAPLLHTLTRKGRELIDSVDGNRSLLRQTGNLSRHLEQINDFHIALMLATRRPQYPTLFKWQQGKGLYFEGQARTDSGVVQVPIVPDAFFALNFGRLDYAYFLEIDRGTTDLRRIRLKSLAYMDLWRSKLASQQLGVRSFRVLYVTTTERRLGNMLKALKASGNAHKRLDVICITEQRSYSLNGPERLFDTIWKTVNSSGQYVNLRVFPTPPTALPTAPANPAVRGPDSGAS